MHSPGRSLRWGNCSSIAVSISAARPVRASKTRIRPLLMSMVCCTRSGWVCGATMRTVRPKSWRLGSLVAIRIRLARTYLIPLPRWHSPVSVFPPALLRTVPMPLIMWRHPLFIWMRRTRAMALPIGYPVSRKKRTWGLRCRRIHCPPALKALKYWGATIV